MSPDTSMSAQIERQLRQLPPGQELLAPIPVKANEIKAGPVTYSGIFVELIKADQPLQLINPAAPAEYGSSEDNTVINPMTGRGDGLKLFSIGF